LSFPSQANKPSGKLSEAVIMLYGEKKIGKTSLAGQFSKNMLHIMCEPMARELPIHQVDAPDYEHFKEWCRMIVEEKHNYDSVSVDTLPIVYKYAMKYTGKVRGFEHPHDEKDYGKSWGFVADDFNVPLQLLLHSKFGIIFHAHEVTEDIETRAGDTFTRRKPEGSGQVWEFVNANIENIWYFHKRGSQRFLQVRGDDYAFACTAFTDKFFTPSGEQIFAVPMGNSPTEGYKNLVKAFKNQQKETYEDFRETKEVRTPRRTARRRK